MNDIAYTKFTASEVDFPHIRKNKTTSYELPSDDQINTVMNEAKAEAIEEANKFGMTCTGQIDEFSIFSKVNFDNDDDEQEDVFDDIENEMEMRDPDDDSFSAFVLIKDENGVERKVRKSTLIWMLTEPSQFLSKDRLSRFRSRKRKTPIE